MEIKQQYQYNQGISRYKLLSATAGVGSIITIKMGYYVLISDINKWEFIKDSNDRIERIRTNRPQEDWYKESKIDLVNNVGIKIVDDERFITFIKEEKALSNLLCLGV